MTGKAQRTKMSFRNAFATFTNKIITIVLNFLSRTLFIRVLGTQYLGLSGLFGNIFSVISLCELGFGVAFTQSLYKPIAENDEIEVSRIINYYTKIYTRIAVVCAVLCALCVPFLDVFVKSDTKIDGILGIYILFSLHTVVSFLLTPKMTLLICDQHMYLVSVLRSAFCVIIFVLQCIVLIYTQNYTLYLCVRILLLCVQGCIVNVVADKKYTFLKKGVFPAYEYKKRLFKNVKALMFHKIGGILSHSTDSLLISYILGLECMGMYSNYALVINSVVSVIDIAIGALSASVGNLGASESRSRNIEVLRQTDFLNFTILTVCSCVLCGALNPVMALWIGKELVFGDIAVMIIISSFYFSCIRDPVQIFLQGYGFFDKYKYMPLGRAAVNLVLSVIFIKKMGIAGVFLGTSLSIALVPLWCEIKVLFKYGFKTSAKSFYKDSFFHIVTSFVLCGVSFYACKNFPETVLGIVQRCALSAFLSGAGIYILYGKTQIFADTVQMLKNIRRKI